jgi:hypothetical protein
VTKAIGKAQSKTSKFTDVAADAWYAGYVAAAADAGIIKGIGGGKFNPNGNITDTEAEAMTARAGKILGVSVGEDAWKPSTVYATKSDVAAMLHALLKVAGILG